MNAPTEDFVLNAAQRAEVIAGLNQILHRHRQFCMKLKTPNPMNAMA